MPKLTFHNLRHLPRASKFWKPFHKMSDQMASPSRQSNEQHELFHHFIPGSPQMPWQLWCSAHSGTSPYLSTPDATCSGDHSAMLIGRIYTLGVAVSFSQEKNVCSKFFHHLSIRNMPVWQLLCLSQPQASTALNQSRVRTAWHTKSTSVSVKGCLWPIMSMAIFGASLGSASSQHTVLSAAIWESFQAADNLHRVSQLGGISDGKWHLAAHTQYK